MEKREAESTSAAKAVEDINTEFATLLSEGAEDDVISQKRSEAKKEQETAREVMHRVERAAAAKEEAAKEVEELGTDVKNDDKNQDPEKV